MMQAALDRAEAARTSAQAEADRIRIVAEADQRRLEVEAYGEKAINEAKNLLSSEVISYELRKIIAEVAPRIVEASVKPMERIDSIRVIQANGFGGTPGAEGAPGSANGNGGGAMPNQLVQAALNYRMNLPLVERLLKEVGLDASSLQGLTDLDKPLASSEGSASSEGPAETAEASNGDGSDERMSSPETKVS